MPLVTAGAVSTSISAATNSPSISGVTAGNLLVLTVSYAQQTNGNPPTVAGWKTAEAPPGQTFAGGVAWQGSCIFYLENAAAGTISARVVPGASSTGCAITAQISEYTTGLTTPALDETAHTNATAGASTSGSSGTTAATTNAGSLIVAALGIADEAAAPHANLGISSPATTGYSVLGANQDTTSNTIGYQASYKFVTSSGTQVANWTWTDSSRYTGTIAAFKLAPKITAQPTSQTSTVGGSATFSVTGATSGGTLSYQWSKDGVAVGTNSSSLTLLNLTNQDNGAAITVTLTDDNGSTVSSSAALVVPVVQSGKRKKQTQAFDTRTPGGLFGLPTPGAAFDPFMSLPIPTGGAANYSLTGDAGTYTLSGIAASLKVNRFLSGSAGSYAFTGNASTLALTRKLSGAAGSYALSGQAATFKTNRFLSGSAGSYALTGIAATLSYTPGAGPVNYTLSGATGAYAFTGRTASFSVGRLLSGSNGAYSFTGRAATLSYTPGSASIPYALSGAAGSYFISGRDATFVTTASSTSEVPGVDISFGSSVRSVKTPKWWEKSGQDDESPETVESKPEKKRQRIIPGRDEAKRIIAETAAKHVKQGDIKQSERFAEVRSKIKPLGKEAAGFNWPALYDRMYSQALTDAIRQEMEQAAQLEAIRIQQLDDDALILLLLES